MSTQNLKISQEELLRQLQSGERVTVKREVMEEIQRRLATLGPLEIVSPSEWHSMTPIGSFSKPGLKINLGSGQRPFKSPWINVDCQPKWCPDVIADGANLKDHFADDSAEVIVLHHVYEHAGLGECGAMLAECYRILRPGGSLIVTTPDLRALTEAWLAQKINDYIFCVNLYGAYLGDEADRHKWLYTFETLCASLREKNPWSEVKAFDWREIPSANIAKDWYILGAECIK